MLKRYSRALAAVFSFCALTSTAVLAQTPTGQISGRVTDASGAVLPGVDVTFTQTDTGLVRSVVTNETGQYIVPSLPSVPTGSKSRCRASARSSSRTSSCR